MLTQVDENGKTDDVELKVLVIDSTGAFKGQKHNSTTPSTPAAPGSLTLKNVTVSGSNAVSIDSVNVIDGKARVNLKLNNASATITGTVKATVDGANIVAANVTGATTNNGGQINIVITDDFIKADSQITLDLTGLNIA